MTLSPYWSANIDICHKKVILTHRLGEIRLHVVTLSRKLTTNITC